MKHPVPRIITTVVGLSLALALPLAAQTFELPPDPGTRWFKGNTHTHTTNSDGDSSPEYVASWYRDHGYDFLVLSDHNVFTDPLTLASLQDEGFILIPGEEVTSSFQRNPVHINGLNLPGLVEPRTAETMVGTIQANVDAIREVNGVPHINHPNYGWAFGASEMAQVEGDRLLEIFNGHPSVHNMGGGGTPGMEEAWDILLTGGKRIYGIAVDDAHQFQEEFGPDRLNPGRGWVTVRAHSLDPAEIMTRLEAGEFYSSTGVELDGVGIFPGSLEIQVRRDQNYKYTTTFIGSGGRVLAVVQGPVARYELQGGEGYVRAVVRDSRGRAAWVQPVFVVEASSPEQG